MTALPMAAVPTEAEREFDRQVDALVTIGVPAMLELQDSCFRARLEPLRDLVAEVADDGSAIPDGTAIPFVVVVPDLPVVEVMTRVHSVGGAGITALRPADVRGLAPRPELAVPAVPYLLVGVDIDPGPDSPAGALARMAAAGRSPLTLAEGVAVLVSDPGVLRSRSGFALLGSRAAGAGLPALAEEAGRPRLDWCPERPLNSWPGSASCTCRRAG